MGNASQVIALLRPASVPARPTGRITHLRVTVLRARWLLMRGWQVTGVRPAGDRLCFLRYRGPRPPPHPPSARAFVAPSLVPRSYRSFGRAAPRLLRGGSIPSPAPPLQFAGVLVARFYRSFGRGAARPPAGRVNPGTTTAAALADGAGGPRCDWGAAGAAEATALLGDERNFAISLLKFDLSFAQTGDAADFCRRNH